MAELIHDVVILGCGSAGWMTASYLSKAFGSQLSRLQYRSEAVERAKEVFAGLKKRTAELNAQLPSTYEYLKSFHGAGQQASPTEAIPSSSLT
jgi:hypothetical protein